DLVPAPCILCFGDGHGGHGRGEKRVSLELMVAVDGADAEVISRVGLEASDDGGRVISADDGGLSPAACLASLGHLDAVSEFVWGAIVPSQVSAVATPSRRRQIRRDRL